MTIKITVRNDDDSREIEVQYADPVAQAVGLTIAPPTIIGPKGTAEFWVHATQAVLVREVTP
jgi:hypothetical protein